MFVEPPPRDNTTLRAERFNAKIPGYQKLGNHRDPKYYISQYDGEIRFFDEAFGDLINKVRELGLFDSSILVFTSDHGESMGERDYHFTHGEVLYNEQIHVPLVIRFPGQSPEVKEVRYPVSHVDVLPTILDTISVRYAHALKGQNLLTRREDRLVFSETHRQGSKYTLIVNNMKFIEGDTHELYDIEKDFSENENLMKGRRALDFFSPKADPLKTRLDTIRQQDALRLGAPIFWSIESPMRKELRGLGYVQ